jgi:hypothetical protein
MAADESDHEDLIVGGELGERGDLEMPLDCHILRDQADSFDLKGGATGQFGLYLI